jgi:IMP dehydrogenase
MLQEDLREALTFDDVTLVPAESDVLPAQTNLTARLTRQIVLQVPIVSSAMDTVTEAALAIAMARHGALGFLHRNLSVEEQALEVSRVKRAESGVIADPVTVHPDEKLGEALGLMRRHGVSGLPVTVEGQIVGILTRRDLRLEEDLERRVSDVMTQKLVTCSEGTSLAQAKVLMQRHRIEKLPVVDGHGRLKGLITIKDIEQTERHPQAALDPFGRLLVGAAIGVGADREARIEALQTAGCDVVCIDTAHGHSSRVLEAVRDTKRRFPDLPLVAGNVSTAEGCEALCQAGVDAVKVGQGPGSICTTRIVAGVGVPQLTAIADCARVAASHGIPVIADGGIRYSGDLVKALAAGADTVMIGGLLAGTEEAPGEVVFHQGRPYKAYRGMGSLGAMARGSAERYAQEGVASEKLVPEGVEARVPVRGTVADVLLQLCGGLRSGMGYLGCRDLSELKERARFVRVSPAGLRESHPHDLALIEAAPNYDAEG